MSVLFDDSTSPATAEQVTRDVNLIARNLECRGAKRAAAETAEHIARFWAPLLRSTLFEQARSHPERFSPIAMAAIAKLEPREPPSGDLRMEERAKSADSLPVVA